LAVVKVVKILKGDYTDRDIIDLLKDPEVDKLLKPAGIETISQWKTIGKKLQTALKYKNMNMTDIEKAFRTWGKQFCPKQSS
jgi:hypothetical protein